MTTQDSTSTTILPTGTWTLDPQRTTVTVTVKKLSVLSVPATLAVLSGTIEIDDGHQVINVEVVADAASYKSKSGKRNEHVVGSDFLDADTHPTIVFRAANVTPVGDSYRADGTVTVKGQSTPVQVAIDNVTFNADSGTFNASATLDRKTLGVGKGPSFLIGHALDLVVSAAAVRS